MKMRNVVIFAWFLTSTTMPLAFSATLRSAIQPGTVLTGTVSNLNTSLGELELRVASGDVIQLHVANALMAGRTGEPINIFNVQVGDQVSVEVGTNNQITRIHLQ